VPENRRDGPPAPEKKIALFRSLFRGREVLFESYCCARNIQQAREIKNDRRVFEVDPRCTGVSGLWQTSHGADAVALTNLNLMRSSRRSGEKAECERAKRRKEKAKVHGSSTGRPPSIRHIVRFLGARLHF
jgi:hypothetical protein